MYRGLKLKSIKISEKVQSNASAQTLISKEKLLRFSRFLSIFFINFSARLEVFCKTCFAVNFVEFLKTLFSQNTSGDCFFLTKGLF